MKTSEFAGGPNYICYDLNHGVIANWHNAQAAIFQGLEAIRKDGAESLGLSPWMLEGANDGLFIPFDNGALNQQMIADWTEYLGAVKAAGFKFVLVAPQFYGSHDFRKWETWDDAKFDDIWQFYVWLRQLLETIGVPYLIDLCTEGPGDTRGCVGQFMQTIWTMYTAVFWPDGVPCFDASMSIVPSEANFNAAPDIFRGLDPNGPVNWPAYQIFHPYVGENGPGLQLPKIQAWMQAAGFPLRPWVLGEWDTLDQSADLAHGTEVRQFVAQTKQPIKAGFSWPVNVRTQTNTQIDPAVNPAAHDYWRDAGL